MRTKRILGVEAAHYHCMSRICGGERLLGDREKEVLRGILWQVAEFCGVELLTYCVMSNHFHVLVFVPNEAGVSDAELVRRYTVLYAKSRAPYQPTPEVLEAILAEQGEEAKQWRERLLKRMHDVSQFMKTVKQRFSVWYNKSHGRYGTLWADRFKSVLVEAAPRALATVAAYIDLNAVRAGLGGKSRRIQVVRICGGDGRLGAGAGGPGRDLRRILFGLVLGCGGLPDGSFWKRSDGGKAWR